MIALHLVLYSGDIEGMESPTRRLEVGRQLPRGDEGILIIGPLDLLDPRVFNHAEDELPSFTIRGFGCRVVSAQGLVCLILSGVDRCLLIVFDKFIVNIGLVWSGGMRKCSLTCRLLRLV